MKILGSYYKHSKKPNHADLFRIALEYYNKGYKARAFENGRKIAKELYMIHDSKHDYFLVKKGKEPIILKTAFGFKVFKLVYKLHESTT